MYQRPRKWIELSDRGHVVSLAKRRRPNDDAPAMAIHVREAFQRKGDRAKRTDNAIDGEVTKMETDESAAAEEHEVDSGEKTDLGTEKETKALQNYNVIKADEHTSGDQQVTVKKEKESENGSDKDGDVERMDEEGDVVDGKVKVEKSELHAGESSDKDNSKSNESNSNKTVKHEDKKELCLIKTETVEDVHSEKENRNAVAVMKSGRQQRRARPRQDLEKIIGNLLTNRKPFLAKVKLSSPKLDALMHTHQHVSPRKRILREFERVSLDEAGGGTGHGHSAANLSSSSSAPSSSSGGKRHRSRVHPNGMGKSGSSSSTFFVPSTGMLMGAPQSNGNGHLLSAGGGGNSKLAINSNGAAAGSSGGAGSNKPLSMPPNNSLVAAAPSTPSKPISSYSIISLLGHNSSGSSSSHSNNNNNNTHSASPRNDPPTSEMTLNPHHQQQFASSQQQQMESAAAGKGMDLQQYNKSLPPKKKLSSPPAQTMMHSTSSNSNHSWSSPKATDPPLFSLPQRMRSPEMSPSPEQSGRLGGLKSHYAASSSASGAVAVPAATSFHPYLNVSNRASPSDDGASLNGNTRYAHHPHRSSPQFIRDRHLSSGSSPSSRYSPVHGITSGKNPPAAHGAASPYSNASRPSPMSATSPLSSHYFPTSSGVAAGSSRRSPSPVATRPTERANDRFLMQRRLLEEDRDRLSESELNALAMQQQQQQHMEFERYAKFYGAAGAHGVMAPGPPPPHLMVPGFEHLSAAGGASPASLMSSLHQAAYLMYPPTGANGGGGPGGASYISSAYYQQYMAAAAAAMYGRGSPLWPYMAAGGIPGPPSSPMRMPPGGVGGASTGLHHSPQIMQHAPSPGLSRRDEARGRMSPGSPLAFRLGETRVAAVATEHNREDPGKCKRKGEQVDSGNKLSNCSCWRFYSIFPDRCSPESL